ncbi:cytochrome P450 CYP94D108-like [Arachis stenosperma]|uniref:cytochrome P450 CYP94D108-like n=1 Tax=Arachis stenosperma TaxID=217475 RepID=UPI0025ACD1A4|nr:cytochrome P450 CYP94D108-like [Arachis stenosperma]
MESLLLFLSLFIFIFIYIRHFYTTKTQPFKTYPLVGSLPDFILNRHRFLDWSTNILRHSSTQTAVFYRPGTVHGVITANPDNVQYILKTNFHNYPKGNRFLFLLHDFLGHGIFNSDGFLWKLQRKTASYEFNTKSLRNFAIQNVTVEIQTRLIPLLQRASETETVLDLQDVLERFAFDNVCKLAFNVDPACLGGRSAARSGDGFMQAFEDAATLSSGRFMSAFHWLWRIKRFLNVGNEKRLKESISTVHAFADEIIRSRMEAKGPTNTDVDLLSRFMAAEDNSPEFLRDIVISVILAGRDTTSSALSWFFWILSSRPDVKEKIIKEIKSVREKCVYAEAVFGYEELKDMNYLMAAISEAMRLYPPVPVDFKNCLNDDVFPDGTVIKRNWFIMYHTYAMGRMESIWGKDCTEYKPERWFDFDEDGNEVWRSESPFRYPVFHAGPRMCLGKDMAYIQMKSIVASVLERFEIDAVDKDTCPEHLIALTLRMKGGLPVRVRVRA